MIDTIYIGGGTPTSLSIEQLETLLNIVENIKSTKTEYTIECNIENLIEDKLELLKKYGINRLSIGVQSFNDKKLKYLGRIHTGDDAKKKIKMAKEYFSNINVDLIYAVPNETLEDLNKDLDIITLLDIQHISTYSLIIEDRTILKNNKAKPISEELDANMYKLICDKLSGFNHYEISNFGKLESKHNLTYWNNEEYYGFGVGASGYVNEVRYENTKVIKTYVTGKFRRHEEVIDLETKIKNEFMLGLRKIKGINIIEFKKKYNREITEFDNINKLIEEEKLVLNDNQLYISSSYIYLSNEILIDLI